LQVTIITNVYMIRRALSALVRLVSLCILFLAGCSPAHVNPLDPQSGLPYPLPPDLPSAFTTRVRSVHIAHGSGAETYSVLAEAWSDGSVSVDSVQVTYQDRTPLDLRLTTTNIWTARMAASYFNDPFLGGVIGQPFGFIVRLHNDSVYRREPVYLFRVIETTPQIESPMHAQVIGPRPDLIWQPYSADFPFHFLVTVVVPAEPPLYESIAWESGVLDSTRTSVTVGDSLADGPYYWTLTVTDPFENISRSVEGTFAVSAMVGQP
jgi:hypothetical protein